MTILAIETSCDETAVAVLDGTKENNGYKFHILGNALRSQVEAHKEYGGVFPALAKREHAKNIVPLLERALQEARMLIPRKNTLSEETKETIREILEREPGLTTTFLEFLDQYETPPLDAIAVTNGPGLAPALWVGVNAGKALHAAWKIPLIPINHMEGHIVSGLAEEEDAAVILKNHPLPVLALLISGGHTELVLMEQLHTYRLIGATRDDAVGEAFDKVARMMNLPYPGGPEISKLAEEARNTGVASHFEALPRPMLHDGSCDFSFSGLKTAVLYMLKNRESLSEDERKALALEFEETVGDVLWGKTSKALSETKAKTLVLGGGVSANAHVRRLFTKKTHEEHEGVTLRIPDPALSTDNAIMIGIAGILRGLNNTVPGAKPIEADGTLSLA